MGIEITESISYLGDYTKYKSKNKKLIGQISSLNGDETILSYTLICKKCIYNWAICNYFFSHGLDYDFLNEQYCEHIFNTEMEKLHETVLR